MIGILGSILELANFSSSFAQTSEFEKRVEQLLSSPIALNHSQYSQLLQIYNKKIINKIIQKADSLNSYDVLNEYQLIVLVARDTPSNNFSPPDASEKLKKSNTEQLLAAAEKLDIQTIKLQISHCESCKQLLNLQTDQSIEATILLYYGSMPNQLIMSSPLGMI